MSIGPKNSSLYKYFLFDKLVTPEMVVCAFVLSARLASIDDKECRMYYTNSGRGGSGNGYVEISIEPDFEPNNEFAKLGRDKRIKLLDFGAFNYNKDMSGKPDTSEFIFYNHYALKMLDNSQILILNETRAKEIITEYKDINLGLFYKKGLENFTNKK